MAIATYPLYPDFLPELQAVIRHQCRPSARAMLAMTCHREREVATKQDREELWERVAAEGDPTRWLIQHLHQLPRTHMAPRMPLLWVQAFRAGHLKFSDSLMRYYLWPKDDNDGYRHHSMEMTIGKFGDRAVWQRYVTTYPDRATKKYDLVLGICQGNDPTWLKEVISDMDKRWEAPWVLVSTQDRADMLQVLYETWNAWPKDYVHHLLLDQANACLRYYGDQGDPWNPQCVHLTLRQIQIYGEDVNDPLCKEKAMERLRYLVEKGATWDWAWINSQEYSPDHPGIVYLQEKRPRVSS
jgi:hypothetical protein